MASPADIGAARYGLVAVFGTLVNTNVATGEQTPAFIGTSTVGGAPTDRVVIILYPDNFVVTMFPVAPGSGVHLQD